MAKDDDFINSLFCCYLPCKMYEIKNGGNIAEKGIKRGMPEYECTVCRKPFTISSVIRRENNLTGVMGAIVYNVLIAVAILFFVRIPIIYKLFFLSLPLTLLIISMRKFIHTLGLIRTYRNQRAQLIGSEELNTLNAQFEKEREVLQNQVA